MLDFLYQCAFDKVADTAAAAQTLVTGDILDMQGQGCFDSVCYIAATGDVTDTCVLTLTAYYDNTDSAMGSEAACTTTATFTCSASTGDDKLLVLDCKRIPGRYTRVKLTRGTANAVLEAIIAIRYNEHDVPVTQSADVVADEESIAGA